MSPSRGLNNDIGPEWSVFSKETLLATPQRSNDDDDDEAVAATHDDVRLTIDKATTIAASFLLDYEAGRPPSFSSEFNKISDYQLILYKVEFSTWWRWLGLYPATLFMFVAYFKSRIWTTVLNLFAVSIFLADLYMKHGIFENNWLTNDERRMELLLSRLLLAFLILLGLQSWLWFFWAHPEEHFSTLLASLFKPFIFFYLSKRARDTLEALLKIGKILARVVIIELFLILSFAAVACRLYYNDEGFESLAVSWLSLFQCKKEID